LADERLLHLVGGRVSLHALPYFQEVALNGLMTSSYTKRGHLVTQSEPRSKLCGRRLGRRAVGETNAGNRKTPDGKQIERRAERTLCPKRRGSPSPCTTSTPCLRRTPKIPPARSS